MNYYIRWKSQLLAKVSCKIKQKAENIFLHTSNKISENFDSKHLQRSKTDLSKETKKGSKKRYSTSFRSSHLKLLFKKGVLKSLSTCLFAYYWNRHQVVIKKLSKSVKILIEKQPFLQYFTLKKFYFLQINQ